MPAPLSILGGTFWTHAPGRRGVGVSFDCPLCVKACASPERVAVLSVPLANPLDGGPPEPTARILWTRTGDTLEALTLDPSIDASGQVHDHGPGWHGFIRSGHATGGGA